MCSHTSDRLFLVSVTELRLAEQLKLTHKLVPEHLAKELKPKIDAARASLQAEQDSQPAGVAAGAKS